MRKKYDLNYLIKKIFGAEGKQDENCIGPEDLALFIEGKLKGEKKEYISGHIAKCERCYDAFLIASDIYRSEKRSFLMTIPLRAIAATLLVFFFSVYLFFRLNVSSPDILSERNKIAPAPKKFYKEKKPEKREKKFVKPSIISERVLDKEIPEKRESASESKEAVQAGKSTTVNSHKGSGQIKGDELKNGKSEEIAGIGEVKKVNDLEEEHRDEDIRSRSVKRKTQLKLQISKPVAAYMSLAMIPEIERSVDLKTAGKIITPGVVIAEFELNSDGTVKNISLLSADKQFRQIISDSLKQWIFTINDSVGLRFKLNLQYDSAGKWELKKINGRKNDADSD